MWPFIPRVLPFLHKQVFFLFHHRCIEKLKKHRRFLHFYQWKYLFISWPTWKLNSVMPFTHLFVALYFLWVSFINVNNEKKKKNCLCVCGSASTFAFQIGKINKSRVWSRGQWTVTGISGWKRRNQNQGFRDFCGIFPCVSEGPFLTCSSRSLISCCWARAAACFTDSSAEMAISCRLALLMSVRSSLSCRWENTHRGGGQKGHSLLLGLSCGMIFSFFQMFF